MVAAPKVPQALNMSVFWGRSQRQVLCSLQKKTHSSAGYDHLRVVLRLYPPIRKQFSFIFAVSQCWHAGSCLSSCRNGLFVPEKRSFSPLACRQTMDGWVTHAEGNQPFVCISGFRRTQKCLIFRINPGYLTFPTASQHRSGSLWDFADTLWKAPSNMATYGLRLS